MSEVRLNDRERLIESILRMPNDQVETYGKLLNVVISRIAVLSRADYLEWLSRIVGETNLELEDELEDELDHALIESRKGEPGIPFDDVLKELGFTHEELAEVARKEGLIR